MCDCCPSYIQDQICLIPFENEQVKQDWIDRLKLFKIPINAYDQLPSGNPIAHGGFGEVFPYIYRQEKTALKKIKNTMKKNVTKNFFSEIMMLSVLNHDSIIKMTGYTFDLATQSRFIICEWVDGCDLNRFIHHDQNLKNISAKTIVDISLQIAHGMRYIHAMGILHRDLKTSNVMYDPMHNIAKIIDFGMASMQTKQVELNMKYRLLKAGIDIRYWMAPEQINPKPGQIYNEKSDVFSYGLILYELGSGTVAYHRPDIKKYGIAHVLNEMKCRIRFEKIINEKLTEPFKYLILNTTEYEQNIRPDFHLLIKQLSGIYADLISHEQEFFEMPDNNLQLNMTDKYLEFTYTKQFQNDKDNFKGNECEPICSMLRSFLKRFSKRDNSLVEMYRYAHNIE